MKKAKQLDRIILGGLHKDDFEQASGQYEDAGYMLVCFELDVDGYHWRAIYVRADLLEKRYLVGTPRTVSLCLCVYEPEVSLS